MGMARKQTVFPISISFVLCALRGVLCNRSNEQAGESLYNIKYISSHTNTKTKHWPIHGTQYIAVYVYMCVNESHESYESTTSDDISTTKQITASVYILWDILNVTVDKAWYDMLCFKYRRWKLRVVMIPTLPSLATPQVVVDILRCRQWRQKLVSCRLFSFQWACSWTFRLTC